MTTLYTAVMETRSCTFTGVGSTKSKAKAAMRAALQVHATQVGLHDQWWKGYDFNYTKLTDGDGLRDDEKIFSAKRKKV